MSDKLRKAIEFGLQYGTKSGRFSCSAPNFQNITREMAKKIQQDYEEVYSMIFGVFPGNDGIGADVSATAINSDVTYNGHRAKIVQFDPMKDRVEFKDKDLIPPTMWVGTSEVRQPWGQRVVNPKLMCPKCEVAWKGTVLARFSVWDCPSCGAKKEDYAS